MIIITSVSPGHSNAVNQHGAIESWQQYGDCYSLNCESEIEKMQDEKYNIKFVKTDKTMELLFSKPLVNINAILDIAKMWSEDLLYLNSDIILGELPELKQDGITIFSRYDYSDSMSESQMFTAGFDAFFIPKKFLSLWPPSIYALGAAWHDFWLPWRAILKEIPVYWPKGKFAFHKIHPVQYHFDEWCQIGEFFKLEFKMNKQMNVGQVATNTLFKIKEKLI